MSAEKHSSAKSTKSSIGRAQQAQQKAALIKQLEKVQTEVAKFFTGRPPVGVVTGSYQAAIDFKDLVCKTRKLSMSTVGSPRQIETRIARFQERLAKFKKWE